VETAQSSEQIELRAYLDAGDLRGAGTWLVERHAHEVIGLCRAMVRDAHLAEDLAQEVFGRAFTGLHAFRSEASPRTWLLAIARNRCIDHLRLLQRDPWRGAPPETDSDPDQHPDERPLAHDLISRRDEVASAMAQLTEGERALVVLRYRHGLEYSELAHVFGLKQGTVRMRISRALSRMRRALQPTMHDLRAVRPSEPSEGIRQAPAQPAPARAAAVTAPAPGRPAPHRQQPARPSPPPPSRRPPPPASPARRAPAHPFPAAPAPASNPLVAVLGLLDSGVPTGLRDRLLGLARQL